jgi:CBS domain containing-hemolysin-like protein
VSTAATLVIVFVTLLVAAWGSLAETAISRMGRAKAHQLAQAKRKGADRLVALVEDPAPTVNVVLLVTLLAQVTGTVLATSFAIDRGASGAEAIVILVMTVVLFVFAVIVPKSYVVQRTERAALLVAGPVMLLARVLAPLSKLLIWLSNVALLVLPGRGMPKGPFVTEDELRHMVDFAEEGEEIEEEERELIHSIFEFGDTVVREVMVPRPDMVSVKASSTLEEALGIVIKAGYSRIPIYEGDHDNIVGVLYAKDLMKRMHEKSAPTKVSSLGRAPTFIPEQKKVAELLREMQKQHVHMAIVVDEYGGTAGLVTIEDLIEEIVGEIVDEYDQEEPLVEPIDDDTIRVDAKMPIDEVNDLLEVELPHEEWDTVGGLVYGLTGRVPIAGEKVRFDGLEFTTERVTGRRIQKVVITRSPHESAPDPATS